LGGIVFRVTEALYNVFECLLNKLQRMNTKFRYGTVMEAMDYLRQRGYDKDFELEANYLLLGSDRFDADDLKIDVTFRYEGATNPGEEATVYGIATGSGIKGILIVTDGIYAEDTGSKLLKKLHQAKNQKYQAED
jgi:hypothetical protein